MRKLFLWSILSRLVNSQLSKIGAAATIVVPIVFSVIAVVSEIVAGAGVPIKPTDTQILWRYLASELYVGGVLIVFSKFVVDVFCPDAIRRYATREEFVAAAASYRTAVAELNRLSPSAEVGERAVLARLVEAISRHEHSATEIIKNWNAQNTSASIARVLAGLLFYVGAGLVVVFLGARLSHNMALVLGWF